jgi:two-component system, OmpR family, sensor kinase
MMYKMLKSRAWGSSTGMGREEEKGSTSEGAPAFQPDQVESDLSMGQDRIKIDFLIHDFKVPLAVIEAGLTAILNRQDKYGPLTEKQEKVILRALRNTKVTQTLVNDALELGRSREGIIHENHFTVSSLVEGSLVELFDLADCNASELIKACTDFKTLKDMLKEKGVVLVVDEELWCREVCLDQTKVRQILRNLLGNAIKYRKREVVLKVSRQGDLLVFSVKDDGEGIPVKYHQKIFQSYFQMDSSGVCSVRGHGLGLAGVMVLVEDLGGELFLESDEGKGADFRVQVPLKSENTALSPP